MSDFYPRHRVAPETGDRGDRRADLFQRLSGIRFPQDGGNPAGNACLTDGAFVANRFRVGPARRVAA